MTQLYNDRSPLSNKVDTSWLKLGFSTYCRQSHHAREGAHTSPAGEFSSRASNIPARTKTGEEELRQATFTRASHGITRQKSGQPTPPRAREWHIRAAQYVVVIVVWAITLWGSTVMSMGDRRRLFLVAHLAALVIGLGSAVMIEYCGFLWMLGRGSLGNVRKLSGDFRCSLGSASAGCY